MLIELEETTPSDNDIVAVLETREREISKPQRTTFKEELRYISTIDVRVRIAEGVAHFTSELRLSASKPVALLIVSDAS